MKTRSKKTFGNYFAFFIYILIGLSCGIIAGKQLIAMYDKYDGFKGFLLVECSFILLIFIVLYLQIIIHEGGHLIFGLLTGYSFVSFRIGSLMLIKTNEGLKFKRYSLMGTGGQCLLSPPPIKSGRFPYVLYNLGGCLSNVICSTIALVIYLLIGKNSFFSLILIVTAITGYGIALVNGIPLKLGDINNDGHNALNLGKNPSALRSLWLQLKINAEMAKGVRMRDMPDEWFRMPRPDEMSDAITAGLAAFIFTREMDCAEYDKARYDGKYILDNATGLLGLHDSAIKAELLFLELVGECRPVEVDRLYSDVQRFIKVSRTLPSAMRLMYAYELLYRRDTKEAQFYLDKFESSCASYPNSGEIENERELLALVKEKSAYPVYPSEN